MCIKKSSSINFLRIPLCISNRIETHVHMHNRVNYACRAKRDAAATRLVLFKTAAPAQCVYLHARKLDHSAAICKLNDYAARGGSACTRRPNISIFCQHSFILYIMKRVHACGKVRARLPICCKLMPKSFLGLCA